MYQTPALKEAVAKIRRAVSHKQGLACIFGDVGFGKSSMLRLIGAGYDADEHFCVATVPPKAAQEPPFTFLREISREFDIPPQRSTYAQMDAIEEFLAKQHEAGNTVLILIDEAQLLRLESMELIRALLNYETNTEKLCQVVLAGQLELRDRMMTRKYKAFRSRIVAPVVLQTFTPEETESMVAFRQDYWRLPNRFSHAAALRIHELSRGVPRDIVSICAYACDIADQCLVEQIEPPHVDRAFAQLQMTAERETADAIGA